MATNETSPATDEAAAAANARAERPAENARHWLLTTHAATLCTTSAKPELEGYPFGSIVPFCLTSTGHPVVFIANIAAHTANLRRDPRASLFVHDPSATGDPQKSWRITVMGQMRRLSVDGNDGDVDVVTETELHDIRARYEERIPFAMDYDGTHDFAFWRMSDIVRVRYIAGFGKICWLTGDEVLAPDAGTFGDAGAAAIAHMNADHGDNLREICDGLAGFRPEQVQMATLAPDGFRLATQSPNRQLFVSFGEQITAETIRPSIIGVLQKARALLAAR